MTDTDRGTLRELHTAPDAAGTVTIVPDIDLEAPRTKRAVDYDWGAIARYMGSRDGQHAKGKDSIGFYVFEFGFVTVYENGGEVNVTFEKSPWTESVRTMAEAAGVRIDTFTLGYSVGYWDNRFPGGAVDETVFAVRLLGALRNNEVDYGVCIPGFGADPSPAESSVSRAIAVYNAGALRGEPMAATGLREKIRSVTTHLSRHGDEGYGAYVNKIGREWWVDCYGSHPSPFKTRKAARAAVDFMVKNWRLQLLIMIEALGPECWTCEACQERLGQIDDDEDVSKPPACPKCKAPLALDRM